MKILLPISALLGFFVLPFSAAAQDDATSSCEQLKALYLELGERSGTPTTPEEAHEAVYGENPTETDCAMMIELFKARGSDG